MEKILVVGPSWVGDMVMAQTLFKVLKMKEPHAQIDVLAPNSTYPLLERMPEVSHPILFETSHGKLSLKYRFNLAKKLRDKKYDWGIVLPGSWKSALILALAKIPKRTGWRGEMRYGLLNDIRFLNKEKYPLMIKRFCALAWDKDYEIPANLPNPCLSSSDSQQQTIAEKFSLKREIPLLVIAPGAEYGPAKRWPPSRFAAVAKTKLAKGWQIVLLGSSKDLELGKEIEKSCGHEIKNLIGLTSLLEALDIVALSSHVLCNDSGIMHIAAALDRPVTAIYGSSTPKFTPPLTNKANIVSLNLPCSPCFKRECPLGHFNCLNLIEPETVEKIIEFPWPNAFN